MIRDIPAGLRLAGRDATITDDVRRQGAGSTSNHDRRRVHLAIDKPEKASTLAVRSFCRLLPHRPRPALCLGAAATGLLLFVLLVPHAHVIPTATPADNGRLTTQLNVLTGSSITSMLIGLAPFCSISVPAEIAALGTEMGVINTPASFSPPADKSVRYYDDGDSDVCRCDLAITAGREADTSRLNFFRTDRLLSGPDEASAFGKLGDPIVYHPHGSVRVSLDNPGKSGGRLPHDSLAG